MLQAACPSPVFVCDIGRLAFERSGVAGTVLEAGGLVAVPPGSAGAPGSGDYSSAPALQQVLACTSSQTLAAVYGGPRWPCSAPQAELAAERTCPAVVGVAA